MKKIEEVTVIGSGIMGAGIADAVLRHGLKVRLFDIDRDALEKAVAGIKGRVRRNVNPDNLGAAVSLDEALEGADMVIEAVVENQEVKNALFRQMGEIAADQTIFASNTSSLRITEMARASGRPDRFAGSISLILRLS